MSYKPNIYYCMTGCTQKGTVDPERNRVDFLVSQSKGPKSSTRMASKNQTHRGHEGMLFVFSPK